MRANFVHERLHLRHDAHDRPKPLVRRILVLAQQPLDRRSHLVHVSEAPRWDGEAPFEAAGDAIVIVDEVADGLIPVPLSHDGESNFAIWTWGESYPDLILNDIGTYEGTTLLPDGSLGLQVNADDLHELTGPSPTWGPTCSRVTSLHIGTLLRVPHLDTRCGARHTERTLAGHDDLVPPGSPR